MGQDEIVVDMAQCQLILPAVLALAQRIDPTSYRRHALPDVQVQPFHKRGTLNFSQFVEDQNDPSI
jgi:hypothetical protein